ncbi:hypothetical protein ACFGVS_16875 [Mucilaginibacter sp. AW1-7]|uniref:hypothetical protein n=1 Tax=Mucilaginibacter sp. AW1-7 TaxID=3349874 RepID=UPI003F732F84
MSYNIGTAKLEENITINDYLQYPIWMNAFNVEGATDQQYYQRPVINTTNVTADMVDPFITLKIKDTAYYVAAQYYFPSQILTKIAVWAADGWALFESIPELQAPILLVAVPMIDGVANVTFEVNVELDYGVKLP